MEIQTNKKNTHINRDRHTHKYLFYLLTEINKGTQITTRSILNMKREPYTKIIQHNNIQRQIARDTHTHNNTFISTDRKTNSNQK